MFEKEAEEYARNKMGGKEFELITDDDVSKYEETQKDWQKGAEFGFQKGVKARINTTTISDCPIKDEWHYVKDGDFPKDNKEVLVYMWGSFYIGYYNLQWHFEDFSEESEQVTAWKEIIPPEEED